MPLIIPANSITGGYEVDNSLRFNDDSSDYLNRTFTTPTNNKIWTFSTWFKKSSNSIYQVFLNQGTTSNDKAHIYFHNGDYFRVIQTDSNVDTFKLDTSALFRDNSAWYHIVVGFDSTQATASNRVKIYVNGEQATSFITENYPAQNLTSLINSSSSHSIGRRDFTSNMYFDGYMSEYCFIDGQQLDPTSFGEFDEDSGIWKPIDVSGLTFGTNGFYLDFENSGSLGADVSGNGNNFTVNNLTSIDQTTDTPTNNFCTLNPLTKTSYNTQAEGNLESLGNTSSDQGHSDSTISASSGKWYAEVKVIATNTTGGTPSYPRYGIRHINNKEYGRLLNGGSGSPGRYFSNEGLYQSDGQKYINATLSAFGNTFTVNDIIGIAVDCDNGAVYFSKNGTWQNSGDPTSGASKTGALTTWTPSDSDGFVFCSTEYNNSKSHWNFGNPPFTISSGNSDANGYGNFEYSVPSGYYALNTKNLSEFG